MALSSDESAAGGRDPFVPIGTEVADEYVIEELIGQGGMAQVYRAEQVSLGRSIALKVMRPGTHRDEARLLREAESLAKLSHPASVVAHDVGKFDHDGETFWYIAMELVPGKTLKTKLREDGPLSVDDALNVADSIARSLREAHTAGIIHRDLKPSNIMVDSTDLDAAKARVLDFGIAKLINADTLTDDGDLVGSPRYMSPEQFTQDELDGRADIFALGVLLYEMLTGRHPLGKSFSLGDVLKSFEGDPPDPTEHIALPPAVNALVMRCMARDRDERFASMDEVLNAIAAARPAKAASPLKRIIGGIAALLLLGALAFVLHLRSSIPEPTLRGGGMRTPPVALFIPREGLFWIEARNFFVAAAENLDRQVVVYDAEDNPDLMVHQVHSFARSIGGALVLQNYEGRGDELVQEAVEAGLDVVRFNNTFDEESSAARLHPDDEQTGFALAEDLIEAAKPLAGDGPIRLLVLRGRQAASAQHARGDGLRRALAAHPDVEVVAQLDAEWQRDLARRMVAESVADAHAIWSANDDMALGAIEGAIRAGREPGTDLVVGGVDWSSEAMSAIEDGTMLVSYGGHFMEPAWALLMIEAGRSRDVVVRTPMRPVNRQNVAALRARLRPGAFERIDFQALVDALRDGDTSVLDPELILE